MVKKKNEEVLKKLKDKNVDFVNFQFSDIHGHVKTVNKPISEVKRALERGIWFDGSSIEGFSRIQESDSLLIPDNSTLQILPWTKDPIEARIICDVKVPKNGKLVPFEGDPRYILKQNLKKAKDLGFDYMVGPEIEFFIFKNNDPQNLSPQDKAGYFDFTEDKASDIRKEAIHYLNQMDIQVETEHHEVAPGQHEIDIKYGKALKIADAILTFKFVVQEIAKENGLYASFMPKPLIDKNGSGMHIHQSLFKNDKNAFYDNDKLFKLSSKAVQFMAGQLKHAKAITAITSPTVNSYKRLMPGFEAPIYISWGQQNRSVLIRVPRYTPGRESSTRIELRSPDPSCNPYLCFSVMLAAGLDGIEKELKANKPTKDDVYAIEKADSKMLLPNSLKQAINELKQDQIILDSLGSHLQNAFIKGKEAEWKMLQKQITPKELQMYF